MRKYARLAVVVLLALAGAGAISLFSLYRASRHVPVFYERALAVQPEAQKAAGQKFEQEALSLHNQVRQPGRWEARFTQDEINGWLAADLPVKFPQALPKGASDPRMALSAGQVQLAVRYERGATKTVVSLSGQVQLTQEPNELAVRIDGVRAGALPLPLAEFRDEIAERAAKAGVPIRWTEAEGVPVALVRLPLDPREFGGRRLVVEELRLTEGELFVAGRTELPPDAPQPAPGEPVDSGEPIRAAAPEPETRQR
ncbi:MAG TPA: hypothetical protein VFB80_06730 [Pirellulaceae bacterium]|nr:hypothetical protein [Pirellulaceae bacterium]